MEQFFFNRLIGDLGYSDKQVKPKQSIDELTIGIGSRNIKFRPDYAFVIDGRVRLIADAKSPDQDIESYVYQCSSYCLQLNSAYTEDNPAKHFLLTNGFDTRVYEWDKQDHVLRLQFEDFETGNAKFEELLALLGPVSLGAVPSISKVGADFHVLKAVELSEVNSAFQWCYQQIYKKDNLSQSAAFFEFVKLIFLKLVSDKRIHEAHPELKRDGEVVLPAAEVRFSVRWIDSQDESLSNPIDSIQFSTLLNRMEAEIASGERKRIFDAGESIRLSPETIKSVVEKLQNFDLYSIDADLNGRLFETFLSATMRGKDLGQYFTPRSVVKLATGLAGLQAGPNHIDKVIDACCGTGGFLIEALAIMWGSVEKNRSLSDAEQHKLIRAVAEDSIYGIDVARDPALARIARMNMYLHGDGGASIYQVDALDKIYNPESYDSIELRQEAKELHSTLHASGVFDIALTNPPFAKQYEKKYPADKAVLEGYETARSGGSLRSSLKSSIMFIERYYDLLKPGGRLIAIIDDGLLGSKNYAWVRDFIRDKFIVRAVVSLPGDAFQRSKARVKTSIIILRKKSEADESQPDAFMYYCTAVGVDDSARARTLPSDLADRLKAEAEIQDALSLHQAFLEGKPEALPYTVSGDDLKSRLDVKSCLINPRRNIDGWEAQGLTVGPLSEYAEIAYHKGLQSAGSESDILNGSGSIIELLSVKYAGFAETGEEIDTSDSSYSEFYRVQENDIVISNINAVNGAVAVIPSELSGCFVTPEYTVLKAKDGVKPFTVWSLLRSPEARANLLLLATGIGRTRVDSSFTKDLILPQFTEDQSDKIEVALRTANQLEREARSIREEAINDFESALNIADDESRNLLLAFKPPK